MKSLYVLSVLALVIIYFDVLLAFKGSNLVAIGNSGARRIQKHHRNRRSDDTLTKQAKIENFNVSSNIACRFAETKMSSMVNNQEDMTLEAQFYLELPETAFISEFTLEVGGILYIGKVYEKAEAQKIYDEAKDAGQSAGQITSEGAFRGFTPFSIEINVAAESTATFSLTYQELVVRKLGLYQQRLLLKPRQVVPNFSLNFRIDEPDELTELESSLNGLITDFTPGTGYETSVFIPEGDQSSDGEDGLNREVLIQYDTKHDNSAGSLWIRNKYFINYFSPTGFSVLPKNIIFVIDVSGSMAGSKLQQAKEAFEAILGQLRPVDRFDIVTFSTSIEQWVENELMLVTESSIDNAINFVQDLESGGSTNLNEGVLKADDILDLRDNEKEAHIILLLTDGNPTVGVTDLQAIINNAKDAIAGDHSLFCLGFGNDIDFNFLLTLSNENGGRAVKIYEDTDAKEQLVDFYEEISSPLLKNLLFNFPDNTVQQDSLTPTDFNDYFEGSEIVVAGKTENEIDKVKVEVTAISGSDSELLLTTEVRVETSESALDSQGVNTVFAEKLWAYLKINELFLRMLIFDETSSEYKTLANESLDLALHYNFVTSLTSMVVVADKGNSTILADENMLDGGVVHDSAPSFAIPVFCQKLVFLTTSLATAVVLSLIL